MTKDDLLKVKANLKRKQPAFIRQDAYFAKLNKKWRKPRGLHSKIKDNLKGYRSKLKAGYQTPQEVRGMTADGLIPMRVVQVEQIAELDPKMHTITIGKVGAKRKIEILEAAKNFTFTNASADDAKKLQDRFQKRHAVKEEKQKKREAEQKKLEEKLAKEEKKETKKDDKNKEAPSVADKLEKQVEKTEKAAETVEKKVKKDEKDVKATEKKVTSDEKKSDELKKGDA